MHPSGIALLTGLLLLAGCASEPSAPPAPSRAASAMAGQTVVDAPRAGGDAGRPSAGPAAHEPPAVLSILHDQAREWRGVPYQWGGLSEDGVDCSGLVYLTFLSRLGVKVPRTTAALAHQGHKIARDNLRPGDLVFFRTGPDERHVGIYMGRGRFLHASASQGVRTSSLDNVYWRARFWEARRIPLPSPELTGPADSVSSR